MKPKKITGQGGTLDNKRDIWNRNILSRKLKIGLILVFPSRIWLVRVEGLKIYRLDLTVQ